MGYLILEGRVFNGARFVAEFENRVLLTAGDARRLWLDGAKFVLEFRV